MPNIREPDKFKENSNKDSSNQSFKSIFNKIKTPSTSQENKKANDQKSNEEE